MAIVDSILGVFTDVGEWISSAVGSFMPMFYTAEDGLTFMGILTVMGLAVSVAFLCIGILQRFLKFKG